MYIETGQKISVGRSNLPEMGIMHNLQLGLGKYSIGTAGWHYKDWECVFYPSNRGKLDKLQFYSQFFDCVEIDSTFYNFYSPEKAADWIKRVSDNERFTFSAKALSIFTHYKNFSKKEIFTMCRFLDELASNGRLEAVLLQFPYQFLNTKENRKYIFLLSNIFKNYKLVAELRHLSWHTPLTYNFLEENKLHICSIDQPHVYDNIYFTTSVLGRYSYVRLHGRNTSAWLRESDEGKYDYLYSGEELIEILKYIEELRKRSEKVYIILNNHPLGKAAVNAFSLINLLQKGRKVLIPEHTVYYYPHLHPIAARVDTCQLPIFG
jgi:uncharacterized protein YecE (DUF72 family)